MVSGYSLVTPEITFRRPLPQTILKHFNASRVHKEPLTEPITAVFVHFNRIAVNPIIISLLSPEWYIPCTRLFR